MRLADFIITHLEPILCEWDSYAKSIWPDEKVSKLVLRDHAEHMLRAVVRDMRTAQTKAEQKLKSEGLQPSSHNSDEIDQSSDLHAVSRAESGMELTAMVSEYRALRASIIRLWLKQSSEDNTYLAEDIVRFNESIDQLLAISVDSFTNYTEKSRELFLGILGHDLRTPLQVITMLSHLLMESGKLDLVGYRSASQIAKNARIMNDLIRDLLEFSSSKHGVGMVMSTAAMDLQKLCREVLRTKETLYPDCDFTFTCEGEATGEWDVERLRQVITNILRNAVQHGAATAGVKTALRASPTHVELSVSNQGSPIPPQMLPYIFDLMICGPDTLEANKSGSIGLGLYIAREIVNAHGGKIEVRSDHHETAFTVTLPRTHKVIACA